MATEDTFLFYLTILNLIKFLTEVALEVPKGDADVPTITAVDPWNPSDFLCPNYILNALND